MDNDAVAAPSPPARPPVRRRRPLWPLASVAAVATLVVLGLVVALVVVRAHDDRPRAAAGAVFDYPYSEDPLPHLGLVLLPWTKVQVGVAPPVAELPDVSSAAPPVRAPDGGSFVRVDADVPSSDHLVAFAAVAAPFTAEADVVLRADGRDYPLSGPGGISLGPDDAASAPGGHWVAVEGRPSDLEVRITVDGVTEVVHADGSVDAGQAADLTGLPASADLADVKARPCGRPRPHGASMFEVDYGRRLQCRVNLALRTPYVDGLGWAEPGREFLVVQAVLPRDVDLSSGRGRHVEYWDTTQRITGRVGDTPALAPPVDVNSLNAGRLLALSDPDDPSQLVFDVARGGPPGDLTLQLGLAARLGEPFVTARRTVRFDWTIPGGELA